MASKQAILAICGKMWMTSKTVTVDEFAKQQAAAALNQSVFRVVDYDEQNHIFQTVVIQQAQESALVYVQFRSSNHTPRLFSLANGMAVAYYRCVKAARSKATSQLNKLNQLQLEAVAEPFQDHIELGETGVTFMSVTMESAKKPVINLWWPQRPKKQAPNPAPKRNSKRNSKRNLDYFDRPLETIDRLLLLPCILGLGKFSPVDRPKDWARVLTNKLVLMEVLADDKSKVLTWKCEAIKGCFGSKHQQDTNAPESRLAGMPNREPEFNMEGQGEQGNICGAQHQQTQSAAGGRLRPPQHELNMGGGQGGQGNIPGDPHEMAESDALLFALLLDDGAVHSQGPDFADNELPGLWTGADIAATANSRQQGGSAPLHGMASIHGFTQPSPGLTAASNRADVAAAATSRQQWESSPLHGMASTDFPSRHQASMLQATGADMAAAASSRPQWASGPLHGVTPMDARSHHQASLLQATGADIAATASSRQQGVSAPLHGMASIHGFTQPSPGLTAASNRADVAAAATSRQQWGLSLLHGMASTDFPSRHQASMLQATGANVSAATRSRQLWPSASLDSVHALEPNSHHHASMLQSPDLVLGRRDVFHPDASWCYHTPDLVEIGGKLICVCNRWECWNGSTLCGKTPLSVWQATFDLQSNNHSGTFWQQQQELVGAEAIQDSCWNPVIVALDEMRLLLFYKVGKEPREWRQGHMHKSEDSGETWWHAGVLPDDYLGPHNSKPILLGDGRLLVPASRGCWQSYEVRLELLDPSSIESSCERLRVFTLSDEPKGVLQPELYLDDARRLHVYCRPMNTRNRVIEWVSEPVPSPASKTEEIIAHLRSESSWMGPWLIPELPNPSAPVAVVSLSSMARYPLIGCAIMAYNHDEDKRDYQQHRVQLSLAVTFDNGKQWIPQVLVLEPGGDKFPGGDYSFPSMVLASDGNLHIAYTLNRRNIRHVWLNPHDVVERARALRLA